MRIIFFGDVFGRPGREALQKIAKKLKEKHKADFVIANIENIAHGSGITHQTLEDLDSLGIFDVYTSGDHIWDKEDAKEILKIGIKGIKSLIRPCNYINEPGQGYIVVSLGVKRLLVINALGQVFMKQKVSNPFLCIDEILDKYSINKEDVEKEFVNAILVDFHAEATSEKRALGFYLDGRVSCVLGTHTHVPTFDAQILPKGSAYISDAGMVGAYNSVIGLDPVNLVKEYATGEAYKKVVGENSHVEIGAVLVDIKTDGLAQNIEHIREIIKL